MRLSNWFAVASFVGLGTVGAVGAQGCRVTDGPVDFGDDGGSGSGSGGSGGTGDDGGTVTDGGSSDPCTACQEASCASQYAACQSADSDCAKFNMCVVGCTTADCLTKCGTDHAAGQTAATALGSCTAT